MTPATGPDFAVADGEAAGDAVAVDEVEGAAVAVCAAVAGVVTEAVLPQPAAAMAATPTTHDATRARARSTRGPFNPEFRSPMRGKGLPPGAGERQGYHSPRSARGAGRGDPP